VNILVSCEGKDYPMAIIDSLGVDNQIDTFEIQVTNVDDLLIGLEGLNANLFLIDGDGSLLMANVDTPTSSSYNALLTNVDVFPWATHDNPLDPVVGTYTLVVTGENILPTYNGVNVADFNLGRPALLGATIESPINGWTTGTATVGTYTLNLEGATIVPEPATGLLLVLGAAALILKRRMHVA